jgi:Golgi phosphoprotein 3 (GPP34)
MTFSLPEELVLIATHEDGSLDSNAWSSLDNGIAGARLLDLALAGRIALDDGKLRIADPTPTGEPLADEALAAIEASEKPRDAKHWVGKLAKGSVRKRVLEGLGERGVLAAERGKFLGLIPRTRHVEVDPAPEREARARVRAAVLGEDPAPDARTVALASLLKATGLTGEVFERSERKQAKKRIGELAAPDEVGAAVKSVTDATTAAVTVAIVAATTASAADGAAGGQ